MADGDTAVEVGAVGLPATEVSGGLFGLRGGAVATVRNVGRNGRIVELHGGRALVAVVVDVCHGAVRGELLEVGAQAVTLRVRVGEDAA